MELGEKIRDARVEAGLSQRQLCDGLITRNMLSQIEHGSAKPSMKTLTELARRLEKSVGFFLEEDVPTPNARALTEARSFFDEGCYPEAVAALEDYRQPDALLDRERDLLWILSHLALAEAALEAGKKLYAAQLLQKAQVPAPYCAGEIERRRLLLLGRLESEPVSSRLPRLDEELLLRAREKLAEKQYARAGALLEAAEDRTDPKWLLLRGEAWAGLKQYSEAARCFHGAEPEYPAEAAGWLEICYRELGDYRQAYNYARKNRNEKGKG